jgi:hypothetical protein
MTERLFKKPLSPGAYRQENDGPAYMLGRRIRRNT